MDFVFKIDTPANTSAADPKITLARLTRGRLVGGFLYFPTGPSGVLHFLARAGVHQICPANTDEAYALDDCVVPLHFALDLPEPPFSIDLVTWNLSTLYSHTLTVSIFLEPILRKKTVMESIKNAFSGTNGYQKS